MIPLNLELDAEKRILIISGPNAGGKSITLKPLASCNSCCKAACWYP